MASVSIFCALDQAGDFLWDTWQGIVKADHATSDVVCISLTFADLFADSPAPDMPECVQWIRRKLRERLPGGDIGLLHVAGAASLRDTSVAPRLAAILRALSDVCQVPAQFSLLVLAPDVAVRCSENTDVLTALFAIAEANEVNCRDICWVRAEQNVRRLADAVIPVTRVRAACHALWSDQIEARRPIGLLQGVGQGRPYRDSLSCRLVFNREQWLYFATLDVGRRLTAFVKEPVEDKLKKTAEQLARDTAYRLRAQALSPPPIKIPPFELPAPQLATSPAGILSAAFQSVRKRIRDAMFLVWDAVAQNLIAKVRREIPSLLDKIATGLPEERLSLRQAAGWSEILVTELCRQREVVQTMRQTLLPVWLHLFNDLLGDLPGLEGGGLDPEQPDTWPMRLADLRVQLAPLRMATDDRLKGVPYCVASWVDSFLPGIVDGCLPEDAFDKTLCQPVSEVLAEHEMCMVSAWSTRNSERQRIMDEYAEPDRAVPKFFFRVFRAPRRDRALAACDRAYLTSIAEIQAESLRVLLAAAKVLDVSSRYENLLSVEARELQGIRDTVEPITSLFDAYVARHKQFARDIEAVPMGPARTSDTLELLSKTDLMVLAAKVDPDPVSWLRAGRQGVDAAVPGAWRTVAGRCLESLDTWTDSRARNFEVDLPDLLDLHFPGLVAPRIKTLAGMAKALLLPLRNRNASRRILHQEWHVPLHPRLGMHGAFDANTVADTNVSTVSTTTTRLRLDDRDRLEMHLHLLRFCPEDYQYWNLLAGQTAAADPQT